MDVQPTVTDANAAHFVRVNRATYNRDGRFIEADVENLRPLTGDPARLGVPAPTDNALKVNLTFDLARIGLPAAGTYTVERLDKDKGVFTQEFATAAAGKLTVLTPRGLHPADHRRGSAATDAGAEAAPGAGWLHRRAGYLSERLGAGSQLRSSTTLSLRVKDGAHPQPAAQV